MDNPRDVIYWLPDLTVSGLAERAILKEIARLERANGKPFPKRKGKAKTGRRVSR